VVVTSIVEYETTLAEGEPLRFALAPVDPGDPFRGLYLALRFELETLSLPMPPELSPGDRAYLVLGEGEDGLADARQLRAEPPAGGPYLRVRIEWSSGESVFVHLPLDRYYVEESKAPRAERLYAARPDRLRTYAVVRVRDGLGVIESLVIDGEPF
jgi:uncharacterized membrane-anchored protein